MNNVIFVKAQMSMEMVIGILILIIVAAVVINMFFKATQEVGGVKKYQEDMRYQNFRSLCNGLCNEYISSNQIGSVAKFCYTKMAEPINRATVRKDVLEAETMLLPICGDAIYCFHTYKCTHPQSGTIEWSDCRNILCNAYYDIYKDWGKASQKVLELYSKFGPDEDSRVGSCYELINKDENWWDRYFTKGGPLPCGGTLTITTTTTAPPTASLSCSAQPGKMIKCEWFGCPTDSCNLICSIVGGGTCAEPLKSVEPSGEHIYISMNQGSTYSFTLQDSNFQTVRGPITVPCC